jgi:hypothetical protein
MVSGVLDDSALPIRSTLSLSLYSPHILFYSSRINTLVLTIYCKRVQQFCTILMFVARANATLMVSNLA